MSHETALAIVAKNLSTIPVYIGLAVKATDPVERLKYVIAQCVSTTIYNKSFEKPLNPILGETYQARGQDGSFIFLE